MWMQFACNASSLQTVFGRNLADSSREEKSTGQLQYNCNKQDEARAVASTCGSQSSRHGSSHHDHPLWLHHQSSSQMICLSWNFHNTKNSGLIRTLFLLSFNQRDPILEGGAFGK